MAPPPTAGRRREHGAGAYCAARSGAGGAWCASRGTTSQPEGLVQVPLCFFEFLLLARPPPPRLLRGGQPVEATSEFSPPSRTWRARWSRASAPGASPSRRSPLRGSRRRAQRRGRRSAPSTPRPSSPRTACPRRGRATSRGFGVGRRGGDAARSPMAGASSVAEAARALVEAKRLDGERKCVSPAERCHRGRRRGDGDASRERSDGNRVGRTATGHDAGQRGRQAGAYRPHHGHARAAHTDHRVTRGTVQCARRADDLLLC